MMEIERFSIPDDFPNYPHLKNVTKYFEADDKYQVLYDEINGFKHLRIRRFDDKPICNFMDMQEIKNHLLGKDIVAIQIFPKQDDFVDGSNTYHLWTLGDVTLPNLKDLYTYG